MHAKSIGAGAKDDLCGAIIGGMGTTLLETTGARLKWARMRQKKTQKGLGLEVGVRDVYISQLESGTYSGSRALIARLASALADIARLTRSLQAADDAHFVAGTLDADRYTRTVQRLQAEIAARQTEADRLTARQQAESARGSRADRLADVLANGPAVLASAEPAAANAWLRAHLRVWVKDKAVLIVEWL